MPENKYETIVRASHWVPDWIRGFFWGVEENGKPVQSNDPGGEKAGAVGIANAKATVEEARAAATALCNPPADFSACSQALAGRLSERIDTFEWLGKTILLGVFACLMTSHPAKTLVTKGYDKSVTQVFTALLSMDVILQNRLYTEIGLALLDSSCPIPNAEQTYWKSVMKGL